MKKNEPWSVALTDAIYGPAQYNTEKWQVFEMQCAELLWKRVLADMYALGLVDEVDVINRLFGVRGERMTQRAYAAQRGWQMHRVIRLRNNALSHIRQEYVHGLITPILQVLAARADGPELFTEVLVEQSPYQQVLELDKVLRSETLKSTRVATLKYGTDKSGDVSQLALGDLLTAKLRAANIRSIDNLCAHRDIELLTDVRGIGGKSLNKIKTALEQLNRQLGDVT